MKNLLVWVVIIMLLGALYNGFSNTDANIETIPFSDFKNAVAAGTVSEVKITGQDVVGKFTSGEQFKTTKMAFDLNLADFLVEKNVKVVVEKQDSGMLLGTILSWLPFILIIGFWIYMMRQMQGKGGGGGAMGFGKSKARLLNEQTERKTFEDVAGIEEAKEELEEVVDFLRDPGRFTKLGGKIPKGALLVGPPGTGKTLLARAIAGEANVPFFTISGSDFVEMFVGVGASRVRDMFEQAKKNAPCIIFIDEIDAVGRHRGAGLGGGNDEREQTLNQLLVEMDGFEANEGIIILAATNRPDVLDPALLRPGRFDRQVVVPNPDKNGREKILQVHSAKVPLAPDVELTVIARGTPGFSGADLANLVNEAALMAARRNKKVVSNKEFDDAKDKIMMGSERRSMVMTDDEKKMTAYHEAGHALVSLMCKHLDPIHKATIIPRGRALGMVMSLPERDQYSFSRGKMHDQLAMAMGGRVAEEICFGEEEVSSGASGDIQAATDLARKMVTQWGMSEKLGPVLYTENQQEVFLGHSVAQSQNMSDETAKLIDAEIKRFVEEGYERARTILTEGREQLNQIGEALLEYETLTGDELKVLIKTGKVERKEPEAPKPATTVSAPTTGPQTAEPKDDQNDADAVSTEGDKAE
ncbi:ATP-dependent zinc metalloprotease FtsH [Temperatibacter marinus]|uniref:ATP-dependent zinc metalloprotease FtsH n=2 Tax=Temperatibacter marinus TaxID=1456591 RepID=A0AA52EFT3_9PROT|nr:ATP-dependent zinc metalloprotease FtsH [Temperatibacter marinus]WND02893.1 ATP-dependent zinc metalloprotease FtsH [Temperatibacter marinus]